LNTENISPPRLILKLSAYFLALISAIVVTLTLYPDSVRYLPLGGTHALQTTDIEITESRLEFSSASTIQNQPVTP